MSKDWLDELFPKSKDFRVRQTFVPLKQAIRKHLDEVIGEVLHTNENDDCDTCDTIADLRKALGL